MTPHTENPMHSIVSDVIAGSLITQRAQKLGLDPVQLLNSTTPDTTEIYAAITDFGLNPDLTASHTLLSINIFLKNPEVVEAQVKQVAQLLWNSLGDPENNGSTPPEHYKEAADCIYSWFVFCLIPTRISPTSKQS